MLCIVKYHIFLFFLFFSDSKLTHLLKEELGGNCKTKALLCLTPQADPNIVSSILTFSTRVGQVKNFPIVNDTFAQVISFIQKLLNVFYSYTMVNIQKYSTELYWSDCHKYSFSGRCVKEPVKRIFATVKSSIDANNSSNTIPLSKLMQDKIISFGIKKGLKIAKTKMAGNFVDDFHTLMSYEAFRFLA